MASGARPPGDTGRWLQPPALVPGDQTHRSPRSGCAARPAATGVCSQLDVVPPPEVRPEVHDRTGVDVLQRSIPLRPLGYNLDVVIREICERKGMGVEEMRQVRDLAPVETHQPRT